MDTRKAIRLLKKYKGVSRALGLSQDAPVFDEVIALLEGLPGAEDASPQKGGYGEADFQKIVSGEALPPDLSPVLLAHREDPVPFWHALDEEAKNAFTLFELNVLLLWIEGRYSRYQKRDKRRLIAQINAAVRDRRRSGAYDDIIV